VATRSATFDRHTILNAWLRRGISRFSMLEAEFSIPSIDCADFNLTGDHSEFARNLSGPPLF
jgi:hypothetical protein